jgi:hypothetical protein
LFATEEALWKYLKADTLPKLTHNGVRRLKRELWGEGIHALLGACFRGDRRSKEAGKKDSEEVGA